MRLLSFVSIILFTCSLLAAPKAVIFSVRKKADLQKINRSAQKIIHEHNDKYIVIPANSDIKGQNYYFVQLPKKNNLLRVLNTKYPMALNHKNRFAVLQINNENDLLKLSSDLHEESHACGMLQKLNGEPIVTTKIEAPRVSLVKNAEVKNTIQSISQENIMNSIKEMSSWKTRYHSNSEGELVGEKLKAIYEDLIPSDRTDVEIELFNHKETPQKSIIVRIKGSTTPDDIVILGSHIDSINQKDKNNAPGADDNASGTSTNIEVFRALMASKFSPDKTIEIHGYAAEEVGLVGSAEMASHYKSNRKKVISMVQFDMNGYAGNGDKVTFVSNSTNSGLTKQLMELSKNYLSIPATSAYLMFGSSDHASWGKKGFPVAFPTEDTFQFNRKIHTANDTIKGINSPNQIKEFGKLGAAYLMHFSKDN